MSKDFPAMSPAHYLDTLIHGAQTSSIPVQVSELKLLRRLMDIERFEQNKANASDIAYDTVR